MPGLLYPAYQKFYSALACLARFKKDNDFFSNIASLDTFFSEYRSITLVMKKSLTHTPYIKNYQDKVATECFDPWLNTQRVKAVHTHPVEFSKQISISIYLPNQGLELFTQSFTIEDDTPLTSITDALKAIFAQVNTTEVFFSAKYTFHEKDSCEDILQKALMGIVSMQEFLDAIYLEINEDCPLCNKLREQIGGSDVLYIPKDFMLVDDYVYYPSREEFEKATRMAFVLGEPFWGKRSPLSGFNAIQSAREADYFQKFVVMHVSMGTTELMPTIMVVYHDDTFSLDSFNADVKTTFYRKINETSKIISCMDVREVYFMTVYVLCDASEENLLRSSKERLVHGKLEFLTFMKVDYELSEEEYTFESKTLSNLESVACQFIKGSCSKLHFGVMNMAPIVNAFKQKHAQSELSKGE